MGQLVQKEVGAAGVLICCSSWLSHRRPRTLFKEGGGGVILRRFVKNNSNNSRYVTLTLVVLVFVRIIMSPKQLNPCL